MYMRFVQMKVDPERTPELHDFYKGTVIPSLHSVQGCMFASLIQSHDHPDECVSMTLWDSQANADMYGSSALYRGLIENIKPYLADSTEWKIQLSKDLTLETVPVVEEPVVKSYVIDEFKDGTTGASMRDRSQLYVRIVALKIHPGKIDEFRKIYAEEVMPALRTVTGCRYAFQTEGATDKDEVLSVTLWDSEHDASAYEASGMVEHFGKKLEQTFSGLYQWKLDLEQGLGREIITSDDVKVKHYQVVTGETFKGL